ncbi:MAG: prephenate dehydrogenase/arogenate dehydrogenase family protein [Arenimonas sp.]|uniref:prephenate dehydrogenase/arogenate dehydrogenase family protein n=1 Tax=Arenimonas sp. TaxID=1872635 RepID=UPI0025C1029C|nr:prephenate dehydrogenase/arogenate dehydrogenase family protein [Arenimonas sp.]MBW8367577.1 prephenate dehydrogenase/arogenate dehydrogenase family protein [Arenimonas sp.]
MNALPKIGLLGHGRFGAAFAALLGEHGYAWSAWDANAAVPAGHAAPDLDALVSASDLIVVCVPLDAFESVLRDLRPRLQAHHQVIDVCSVKEAPCLLMHDILGDAIGHAGSHPLFGPLSIARAEPLRTVVCASASHPGTAHLARQLFESIGSEVADQDPSSHDRSMALTHAMAFFIARGLVDLGVGNDLRWAPPSFAALAASIAAVRADAGHLFNAIQNQNPYAAATRQQFIETLTLIDRRLADAPASAGKLPDPGPAALAQTSPALLEAREHIDELDRELIALLRRRSELSTRAGAAKRATGAPVLDPGRESTLLAQRRDWAEHEGLPADGVADLFKQILTLSRRVQG